MFPVQQAMHLMVWPDIFSRGWGLGAFDHSLVIRAAPELFDQLASTSASAKTFIPRASLGYVVHMRSITKLRIRKLVDSSATKTSFLVCHHCSLYTKSNCFWAMVGPFVTRTKESNAVSFPRLLAICKSVSSVEVSL